MKNSRALYGTLCALAVIFLALVAIPKIKTTILTNGSNEEQEIILGKGTNYMWEPWGISFDVPPGIKVGKVNDTMLVVNETGILPDGDIPQMKVYLKQNTTLAAVTADYEKEEGFSKSEVLMNDHLVTVINYDDGFAGPDTVYLVQVGSDVMEYRLARTANHEYDELVANVVLHSLKF